MKKTSTPSAIPTSGPTTTPAIRALLLEPEPELESEPAEVSVGVLALVEVEVAWPISSKS